MNPIPPEIREFVAYESETGNLVWIKQPSPKTKIGNTVGSLNKQSGYFQFSWRNVQYRNHRVAWYLHYGEDPGELLVDHINRDRSDNRISNLRLVTHQQNHQNKKISGVCFHKRDGKWQAHIKVYQKTHHIGYYDCPLLAGIDYLAVKSILHPLSSLK